VFSLEVHLGMADTEMAGESIGAAECLLIHAELAANLLLPRIVDGVFVTSKVVRAGEDSVAGLASAGVDALALVRASLGVDGAN
jgi:hypothetical protein